MRWPTQPSFVESPAWPCSRSRGTSTLAEAGPLFAWTPITSRRRGSQWPMPHRVIASPVSGPTDSITERLYP